MAEAHPVGFRWVMKAKERGATIIHVDPRFSRTSALADIWVPIRAGSDIAFLGGLVRHIIENIFSFAIMSFTSPMPPAFCAKIFATRKKGRPAFFRLERRERAYDKESWAYQGHPDLSFPERDLTLQHPRCVFQSLRRHFARYTPEMVEEICGISPALFHKVADALVRASGPDKTAAICYALGWTQHSKGVQIIRTASILQLLLGNIGRPGGGIMALARSRFDPGLDRRANALRYFTRLSADAAGRRHGRTVVGLSCASDKTDRSVAQLSELTSSA